ncbi:MAG: zinc ribbon domain-containing protein [Aquificota bacterium]|nr:MAG: zinc ribbon domain-containing protein [Aquificota bacterium]
MVVEFLLSEPKLVSSFWQLEDAEEFLLEISKKHSNPALLVSVSLHDYGYRVYMDGEVIHQEAFDEEALVFEAYLISSFKKLNFFNLEDYLPKNTTMKLAGKDPSLPIIYFCPACWSVISQEDTVCPMCGYDLTEFHKMPYEYKLLMGLEHPVLEMRLNVIHTVGAKDLKEAIPQLEHMVNRESNPILLMAIVDALARMSHPEAMELLRKLAHHRYPIVRSRAKGVLEKRILRGL